ncbi:MAG: YkgJ family cysteine cluster protein [Phycisphaeraceae bacterium]|nr:YkgJ family cysteine cluster protein [Phycisphaeraceae bacterium]
MAYQNHSEGPEWFAQPQPGRREGGLSFQCTMCGNCCSGPEGFVLFTDEEAAEMAARVGVSVQEFYQRYTRRTIRGISLGERETSHGLDCIFLDRDTRPGSAVCALYDARPAQCRTWPFWPSNLASRRAWERAKNTCPGMDKGNLYSVQQIRIIRDKVDI